MVFLHLELDYRLAEFHRFDSEAKVFRERHDRFAAINHFPDTVEHCCHSRFLLFTLIPLKIFPTPGGHV
jgi:hypothetical protein